MFLGIITSSSSDIEVVNISASNTSTARKKLDAYTDTLHNIAESTIVDTDEINTITKLRY